jgi:hypothetical protein
MGEELIKIVTSPLGSASLMFCRFFVSSILLCKGVELLDLKNISSSRFRWKRVLGFFLMFVALMMLKVAFF